MTPTEFSDKINLYVAEVRRDKAKIIRIAVQDVLAEMLDRIFQGGADSRRNKIGRYSTKPISVQFPIPGLPNVGRGKSVFFKGGYKEFRAKVGRSNKFVNLDLTGSLRLSIKVGKSGNLTAIGFDAVKGRERAEENEKRFGKKVFALTDDEKQLFLRRVSDEILLVQKKYFP